MSSKTTKQPWRRYDVGFKAQVLNKVEKGQSVAEITKELGISEGIIYHGFVAWILNNGKIQQIVKCVQRKMAPNYPK